MGREGGMYNYTCLGRSVRRGEVSSDDSESGVVGSLDLQHSFSHSGPQVQVVTVTGLAAPPATYREHGVEPPLIWTPIYLYARAVVLERKEKVSSFQGCLRQGSHH